MSERVNLSLDANLKKLAQVYAHFFGLSLQQLLSECLTIQIQRHALACSFVHSAMEGLDIKPDKRAIKPCYGFTCLICMHHTSCRTGLYPGVIHVNERCAPLIRPEGWAITHAFQDQAGQERQVFPGQES